MKRMTVPAMLAAGVLAFTLAGCSGNAAQNMTEDTLKGTWSLDSQSQVGFDAYLSFEDDALAEVLLADSYLEGTWSVSGAEGTVAIDDERDVKLTYSGDKLTWGGADGSKLVFVRDDSEEAKSMFALDDESLATALEGEEGAEGELTELIDGENAEIEEVEYVDEVINPIDPVAVADDEQFAITVTGKGTDFTGDPGYQLSITNKTDKTVYLVPEDEFAVGDKKVEAGLGDELEPGETLETFMYFSQDDLGGALEALGVTDGVILVLDDETDGELARYTFHME